MISVTSEERVSDPLFGTGYRSTGRLGGGASSEVFAAVSELGTPCAVKLLSASCIGSPEARVRFAREACFLAAMDHPRLVRVTEMGETADGRPYFVMPRLEGETVRDLLRRERRLSPERAVTILVDALEGLHAAHAAGLVHRDVKPSNVFVLRSGRAVVLDFGVATIAASPDDLTTGSFVVGTPRYLAPEQIIGGAVDARTDVYAAGVVLHEMLSGQAPFAHADAIDVMSAALRETPRSLRGVASVGRALDGAVMRALAKAPGRRFRGARTFAFALMRALAEDLAS